MAQVTNMLIIWLSRVNLAVTRVFFHNVSFSFSFYYCSEKLMPTLDKEWDQMGSTSNHGQVLKTTAQLPLIMPPRCLRFALQAQLFNHYLVLVALHNFFSLLSQNYLRSTKFNSPLPFSPRRLMPGGILVRNHVSRVTNPSCLCSHDAAGRERLWIIFALSPGGELTLKLQVSVLRNESVKHSSGASRSCSEEPHCLSVTLEMPGPPQVTNRGECSTNPVSAVLFLLLITFSLGFNLDASILRCKRQTTATAPSHTVKLTLCGAQHCSTRLLKNLPNSSSFRQSDFLFQNIS